MWDTEHRPRFVLHSDALLSLLPTLATYTGNAARRGATARVTAEELWPALPHELSDPQREDLAALVDLAQDRDVLAHPAGVRVSLAWAGPDWFTWQVSGDRYPARLSTSPQPVPRLAPRRRTGLDLVVDVLQNAVDAGNHLLDGLLAAAPIVVADIATDPVLLTRLADSDEPMIRARAAANRHAPEEARVLAAMRRTNIFDRNEGLPDE